MNHGAVVEGFDFTELIQLVAEEVEAAQLVALPPSAEQHENALHISGVRVRMGQLAQGPSPDGEAASPPSPMLVDRYPPAQECWQLEVEFGSGPAPLRARFDDVGWMPVTVPPRGTLADLFAELPVDALKGAATTWKRRLEKIGVTTIAELSAARAGDLEMGINASYFRTVLELQCKAHMLSVHAPSIPPSPGDTITLADLVGKTPDALRGLIGQHHFSRRASAHLTRVLVRLYTLIDLRVLESLTLRDLRTAGRVAERVIAPRSR